ncbi:MAG TPA: L-rhamnose isomerase, partial [Spirochaetia bacterium]|nr:L-rhamnose isomerase [Spirochaetia bacterium]
ALLEPSDTLKKEEAAGNHTARLALMEEIKDLPYGAVWDHFCKTQGAPIGSSWMEKVQDYERTVLATRR